MVRLIKFVQILIAAIIGFFLVKDFVLTGIAIFFEQWIIITVITALLLELSLFIIIKLVEDD